MKDREICAKCKWRGTVLARKSQAKIPDYNKQPYIVCDYHAKARKGTCLKVINGKLIDRRGHDFDKCLLFEEGDAVETDADISFGSLKRYGGDKNVNSE